MTRCVPPRVAWIAASTSCDACCGVYSTTTRSGLDVVRACESASEIATSVFRARDQPTPDSASPNCRASPPEVFWSVISDVCVPTQPFWARREPPCEQPCAKRKEAHHRQSQGERGNAATAGTDIHRFDPLRPP